MNPWVITRFGGLTQPVVAANSKGPFPHLVPGGVLLAKYVKLPAMPFPFQSCVLDLVDLRYIFPNIGLTFCWTTTGNMAWYFTWPKL